MRKICDFNFNELARIKIQKINQIDRTNLSVDLAIKKWGPLAKERLPNIKRMLKEHKSCDHSEQLAVLEFFE